MDYIAQNKLRLHLKMGRQLAQFLRTSTYFEFVTFAWVLLQGFDRGRLALSERPKIKDIKRLNAAQCDRFCKLGNL